MALGFNSEILNEDIEDLELIGMDYQEYLSINPHLDPDTVEDYFDHLESTSHLNSDDEYVSYYRFDDEDVPF